MHAQGRTFAHAHTPQDLQYVLLQLWRAHTEACAEAEAEAEARAQAGEGSGVADSTQVSHALRSLARSARMPRPPAQDIRAMPAAAQHATRPVPRAPAPHTSCTGYAQASGVRIPAA